jgi:putative SOS response-associated peptidase YedK
MDRAIEALPSEPVGNFNAPPGAKHWTMRLHDDKPMMEPIIWRYLSPWATKKGMPPAINARLDKLLSSYYRALMKSGRIIVPGDGWFEWTGEPRHKQPWYIKAKTDEPLFFAALTNHNSDKPDPEGAGFVIVTDASAGGMIDIHDRRPVVLTVDDAQLWIDGATPYEQAEQVARTSALRENYFEWYAVSREVNKPGRHDMHLIEPVNA